MLTQLEGKQRPVNKCIVKRIFTIFTMDVILTICVHRAGVTVLWQGPLTFLMYEKQKEKTSETGVCC